ncbi:hypothetical protein LTSEINV_2769 [Salmonella enterica subsp. enterica serovar Inverness str. R8-3668]|uniref:Uncharacterized protein n=1 Tax=Salmonella enterica subsp. enterica serovar Inverness str. R8-3668 TaxID=913075 RepID=G5NDN7_SALET|nr:hypothetical protein LTSEINV_2769 [Salmonella enterica subsp. enterica serovar Inverness str. R8-3668]
MPMRLFILSTMALIRRCLLAFISFSLAMISGEMGVSPASHRCLVAELLSWVI